MSCNCAARHHNGHCLPPEKPYSQRAGRGSFQSASGGWRTTHEACVEAADAQLRCLAERCWAVKHTESQRVTSQMMQAAQVKGCRHGHCSWCVAQQRSTGPQWHTMQSTAVSTVVQWHTMAMPNHGRPHCATQQPPAHPLTQCQRNTQCFAACAVRPTPGGAPAATVQVRHSASQRCCSRQRCRRRCKSGSCATCCHKGPHKSINQSVMQRTSHRITLLLFFTFSLGASVTGLLSWILCRHQRCSCAHTSGGLPGGACRWTATAQKGPTH